MDDQFGSSYVEWQLSRSTSVECRGFDIELVAAQLNQNIILLCDYRPAFDSAFLTCIPCYKLFMCYNRTFRHDSWYFIRISRYLCEL